MSDNLQIDQNKDPRDVMSRDFILLFSVFSYIIGVAGLLALILSMAGLIPLGGIVTLSFGPATACMVNLALLLIFGVQHSVMARPAFKTWSARWVHSALERSVFVAASGFVSILTVVCWQPLQGMAWQSEGLTEIALWLGFVFGWFFLLAASFAINHWDLFGLRQAWLHFKGQEYTQLPFVENWMYRISRHPIVLGCLIGFWSVPQMSNSQLYLAIGMTVYSFIGLYFEERDLIRQWGHQYKAYRARVGFIGRKRENVVPSHTGQAV